MRHVSLPVIVLALAYATAGSAQERIERRVAADPRGEVEIVNVSGEVHVSGWDRPEVEVLAELGEGVERLDVTGDNRRVSVKVILPNGRSRSGSSELVVRIPRDSRLAIRTVSADQTVSDVRGAQSLQAVSGSITTKAGAEDIEVKSVSGEIAVRGQGGSATVRITTVSGDIHLNDVGSSLEVTTVTGDMNVMADEIARVRIKTTNGNLELHGRLLPAARVEAEAINGDLKFQFRKPIAAEFEIETFNGEIDSCFGPEPRRTSQYAPGNELRFKEGAGDARVRIKTLNGGIEVCSS
jgi:DUF4097 and DUF4098 domain-containing protein YvlB